MPVPKILTRFIPKILARDLITQMACFLVEEVGVFGIRKRHEIEISKSPATSKSHPCLIFRIPVCLKSDGSGGLCKPFSSLILGLSSGKNCSWASFQNRMSSFCVLSAFDLLFQEDAKCTQSPDPEFELYFQKLSSKRGAARRLRAG